MEKSCIQIARNILLLETLKKVVPVFRENNIDFLLFKGFDLALRIYGDPLSRAQVDLDFIVPKNKIDHARKILGRLDVSYVDLHSDILNLKRFENWPEAPLRIDGMWERATTIQLDDLTLPVLSPEDLFLALCLHFVFHHHLRGSKWLTDLAWMTKKQDLNWSLILARAKENYLILTVYAVLTRLKKSVAIDFPEDFLKNLRFRNRSLILLARWDTRPTRYLFRLGLLPKWDYRWRMIRETAKGAK